MRKAYFISDTHLGAAYFPDSRERELRVVRFLESIRNDAGELYLLGDILDYWFEYRYVVPRGFVRFFGKLAELADAGVKITWIIGNHDIWISDYIPDELGVEVLDGVLQRRILGQEFVLAHGDGIWQDSKRFTFLRKLFRNKICRKLFSGVHPRWTVPFANGWSAHSRCKGVPELIKRETDRRNMKKSGEGLPENISALQKFCIQYHDANPGCRYYIFGHLHQEVREILPGDAEMVVLGDWMQYNTYVVFDGKELLVKRFNG